MSRTLFWYLFRDLLKYFLMASAVLGAIMSFGGLFKPLTEYGLNLTQMLQMLAYLLPAMQTSSLPIAALFATTVVYGRLAADNELTACRAAGISYLTLAQPAIVLGLILAVIGLVGLLFIVPNFTLRVEKVAFSSMAEFVRKSIERNHQVKLESIVIFAKDAWILDLPPERGNEEAFVLSEPIFCTDTFDAKREVYIPSKFYTAKSATVTITQLENSVEFSARLDDGQTFPRDFKGAALGGVGQTQFGPVPVDSPIRENTKFMTLDQLKNLDNDPTRSRDILKLYRQITRAQLEQEYLGWVLRHYRQDHACRFTSGDEEFVVVLGPTSKHAGASSSEVSYFSEKQEIQLLRYRKGLLLGRDEARQVSVHVQPDLETGMMRLEFRLQDVMIGGTEGTSGRPSFVRYFVVPMPPELDAVRNRTPSYYIDQENKTREGQNLRRRLLKLQGQIKGEMHGRASFGVACLVLVITGAALGMMFRTGNFLSAFALSVIPALLSIALIVTGQHVAEADPANLNLGLFVVWSGNLMVLLLGLGLYGHLSRQ